MNGLISFILLLHIVSSSSFIETQGSIEKGSFYVPVGIGKTKEGETPFQFHLLVDLSTSGTMIPDSSCSSCKSGTKYDSSKSSFYESVGCSSDFCTVAGEDVCPSSHSEEGKCCDKNGKGLCMWDSSIQYDTNYPASGGIIHDIVTIQNNTVTATIINVFDSTFSRLPDPIQGIMGLSEMACNPTCVPPIYHSILQSRDPSYKEEDMKVSICFGKTRGKLMFGYSSLDIFSGQTVAAYQRTNEIGYTFDLQDILINNRSFTGLTALGLDRVVMLESTITEIRLPEDLFNLVKKEFQENYSHLDGVLNGAIFDNRGISDISKYPTFDIKIPGALLHIPPQLYFLKRSIVGIEQYFLQIVPNQFSNTVQLGLCVLRGFAIQFRYEEVDFAPVNSEVCGDDVEHLVGSVEWAPKDDDTDLDSPVIIVLFCFCFIVVVVVIVLVKGQAKKKIPVAESSFTPTPAEPFKDTEQKLIDSSV